MVLSMAERSAMILAQCVMKASLSLDGKAATAVAAGSCCCLKKIGRSASITSRSCTLFVMEISQHYLPGQAIGPCDSLGGWVSIIVSLGVFSACKYGPKIG